MQNLRYLPRGAKPGDKRRKREVHERSGVHDPTHGWATLGRSASAQWLKLNSTLTSVLEYCLRMGIMTILWLCAPRGFWRVPLGSLATCNSCLASQGTMEE